MPRKRCAFLTMAERGNYSIYDAETAEPLRQLGWDVEEVPWDRAGMDWSVFQAVVVRSTWDYHRQSARFLTVLFDIEAAGVRLFNSAALCRWNSRKQYLLELEAHGVPIVPTQWMERFTASALPALFGAVAEDVLVLKPTVGANADATFVLRANDRSGWQDAAEALSDRPVMAQPFLRSVVEEGEYSLCFFDGAYSHAVLKTPASGDFRVQEEHGGSVTGVSAPAECIAVGEQALQALQRVRGKAERLLYARADLVRLPDGTPALMELELIEPSLYFAFDAQAPARFARALAALAG